LFQLDFFELAQSGGSEQNSVSIAGDSNHQWTAAALAARGATRYNLKMIRSFKHKGVERFFKSGSRAGIQAAHAPRLARQLSALDAATRPEDMNRPGWDWHPLKGGLSGHWSVSVNGNWRLTFAFENGDAILVDYQDYH
jgi:proteic killer suppression protein